MPQVGKSRQQLLVRVHVPMTCLKSQDFQLSTSTSAPKWIQPFPTNPDNHQSSQLPPTLNQTV